MIELENITVSIGGLTVLENLSATISDGDRIGLRGINGTGKSTLLRVIAGLHPVTSGQVRIDGALANDGPSILVAPEHRDVAMVFQDLGLWPNLDVVGNIRLGRKISDQGDFEELVSAMGLNGMEKQLVGRLSGGQRQRVAIARALFSPVSFLLLDEPFAAIDSDSRTSLAKVIEKKLNEWKATLLCASHDLSDLTGLGIATAWEIADGKMNQTGITV